MSSFMAIALWFDMLTNEHWLDFQSLLDALQNWGVDPSGYIAARGSLYTLELYAYWSDPRVSLEHIFEDADSSKLLEVIYEDKTPRYLALFGGLPWEMPFNYPKDEQTAKKLIANVIMKFVKPQITREMVMTAIDSVGGLSLSTKK